MTPASLTFDIETHSADERFARSAEDFYRLGGALAGDHYVATTDVTVMRDAVQRFPVIEGHNIISFDVPALGLDPIQLASEGRLLDTMVLDSLLDPPDFYMSPQQAMKQKYPLDKACARYGVPGKTNDLRALAKKHGGYGSIPTDDPDYRAYLRGDVDAANRLKGALWSALAESRVTEDYVWREMRIAALGSHMGQAGFTVDRELLTVRVSEGEKRRAELVAWLVENHDVPTTLPNGKPAKSPHATKAGRAALIAAFGTVGVSEDELPRTDKGAVSLSADGLEEVAARFPDAAELCSAIGALVGIRTVYQTAEKYLHVDGKVHPDVTMLQASGRWSITKPGLTVFGKRGERVRERDIFVASPGHVLFAADLSQVDARSVAAHSGDLAYMALFEPGRDSHEIIARMVWGDALYESNPKYYRQAAKVISHGTNYGMGVGKLALSAAVPEEEAFRVVSTLRESFPDVERWKMEVREQAEAGELLDNGFGRIMRPNPDRAWTQGPALMGQGTARDVMMEGLLRMPLDVQRMVRAVVHDEVVAECPAEDFPEVSRIVVDAMTFDWCPSWMSDPVTFTADCSKPARAWSGCY